MVLSTFVFTGTICLWGLQSVVGGPRGGGGEPSRRSSSGFCSLRQRVSMDMDTSFLVQRKEVTIVVGSNLRKPEEAEFESLPFFVLCDLGQVPFPLGFQLSHLTARTCIEARPSGLF